MGIFYNENQRVFSITTKGTAYVLQAGADGHLLHLYYGAKTPEAELLSDAAARAFITNLRLGDTRGFLPDGHDANGPHSLATAPLEYPAFGTGDYRTACLMTSDKSGAFATDLFYESYEILPDKPALAGLPSAYQHQNAADAPTLKIRCLDKTSGLVINLFYSAFSDSDVITRWVVLENHGSDELTLHRALSGCLDIDGTDFDMISLYGAWANERRFERLPLRHGRQSVCSERGITGHAYSNFAAIAERAATEDYGNVFGLALVYSGNFVIEAEAAPEGKTRLVAGINPVGFSWRLQPGETFTTPELVLTFSKNGLSQMSRNLHDFVRNNIVRGEYKHAHRPVLINNWEATYFDFDDEKLLAIAKTAADCGIETLVMDDGWFGKRNDDRSSLGDWTVNEDKLKGGLEHLVGRVNAIGMRFGIWLEPEMISPDSDLYRAHPDWCLHVPDRHRTTARSQLVLDLSREEIMEYTWGQISAILYSANIEYVKWDMNRSLTEVASAALSPDRQGEVAHRYVLAVYELQRRLTETFPHILLENCAGGGGRFDLGMLCYSPQIWCSDNTDAIARLDIQYGTNFAFPPSCMGAHVSAVPNHTVGRTTPFRTRGAVAAAGTFGYELDVTKLSDEEKSAIKSQIESYRHFEPLIREGDYYRLLPKICWAFVAKDASRAVVTFVAVQQTAGAPAPRVKLKGLKPDRFYKIADGGKTFSGAFLMENGLDMPQTWGDYQASVIEITGV